MDSGSETSNGALGISAGNSDIDISYNDVINCGRRSHSPRHEAPFVVPAEGGTELHSIQQGEAAGGACTRIDKPSGRVAEPFRSRVRGFGNRARLPLDGGGGGDLRLEHRRNRIRGGPKIEPRITRAYALGRQALASFRSHRSAMNFFCSDATVLDDLKEAYAV